MNLPVLPAALIEKPELWQENKEAFEAFLELNNTRQSAFSGVSRITYTEILNYCICYEINPNDITKKIVAADIDCLNWVKEKQENVQRK